MADTTPATNSDVVPYTGTTRPLYMRPESTSLTPDMLVGLSDLTQPMGSKTRRSTLATLADFMRPKVRLAQGSQAGSVVQLGPIATMAGRSIPVVNSTGSDLMIASAGSSEPIRVPGFPPTSTFVLPAGCSLELWAVSTTDPNQVGWFPRTGLPPAVSSVAGRKGDVTIFPADVIGLGSAATHPATDFATATQGGKADTAVQPGDLQPFATTTALAAHVGNTSNPHGVTKVQVGLANVDNTADLAKPISTATATALAGKAALTHTHAVADVTGLQSALDGKASTAHAHAAADITSGVLAPARLATGTPGVGKYPDGGGAWTTLPTVQQIRATTAADGTYTWTYPTPFPAGVVPIIEAVAEVAFGSTDVVNVQVDGTPTNTVCKIRVTRTQRSVAAVLGLTILSVPASVGATVVHLTARTP